MIEQVAALVSPLCHDCFISVFGDGVGKICSVFIVELIFKHARMINISQFLTFP